jgi:hypothetical protein
MGQGKGVHSVPVDNPVEGLFRPFKRVVPGFPEKSYPQVVHNLRLERQRRHRVITGYGLKTH